MIRQSFIVHSPLAQAFEIGSSPAQFVHFVPMLRRVESDDAAIDHVGANYTMIFVFLGHEVRMRWAVETVHPATLGTLPRPSPPWEIGEVGRFGGFVIKSTTRYEADGVDSVVSHVVTFTPPSGWVGRAVQPVVTAAARVGMGMVGRRYARYSGSVSNP